MAGHGPVVPCGAGPRETAIHWRSGWTQAQCGEGTQCNKEDFSTERQDGRKVGGRSGPKGQDDCMEFRVDACALGLIGW